jgi:hypothetical protein
MGYTTTFRGAFTLSKQLTEDQTRRFNDFCEERHGTNSREFPGCPSFWCDWETDGISIFWNGSEKSYEMVEWANILYNKFLKPWGVEITGGEMNASGEESGDIWKIVFRNGKFTAVRASIVYQEI